MERMFDILAAAAIIYLAGLIYYVFKNAGSEDEAKRRAFILYRAQSLWPNLDLCYALDRLYAVTLCDIRAGYALGNNTDELQADLVNILNLRNQIFLEEDASTNIKIKKRRIP